MKRFIAAIFGIMVCLFAGCRTTMPVAQPPEPVTNETALTLYERGNAYSQGGHYEDAIHDFTNAIDLVPGYADAYASRGRALGRMGKPEQAIADFSKAISIDPSNANTYADRGVAYGSMGQHDKAVEDLTQAIALNPNFAAAYYNRAIGYFIQKKCKEARSDVRQAQTLGYPKIQPRFIEDLNRNCPEN